MANTNTVDARGLSCPTPVILVRQAMTEAGRGRIEALVDNDTARENIARLAGREGWRMRFEEDAGGYRLILEK
jgi:tRNA 2-thiouridine synthesizing protein A